MEKEGFFLIEIPALPVRQDCRRQTDSGILRKTDLAIIYMRKAFFSQNYFVIRKGYLHIDLELKI